MVYRHESIFRIRLRSSGVIIIINMITNRNLVHGIIISLQMTHFPFMITANRRFQIAIVRLPVCDVQWETAAGMAGNGSRVGMAEKGSRDVFFPTCLEKTRSALQTIIVKIQ